MIMMSPAIHPIHRDLAAGRWYQLSLVEQLGNVGSEVSRARAWQGKDQRLFDGAVDRALELLDLTIADPRWRGRLKELLRVREIFCDTVFGEGEYQSALSDLDDYFLAFARAAAP